MSQAVERKQHPRSKRLAEVRAARLRGRSRTDFVRDAAVRAAEEVLERFPIERNRSIDENSLKRKNFRALSDPIGSDSALMETAPIRMTAAGFEAFVAALSGPATSVPEMVELLQREAPWETGESDTEG
jgi:uncharacterized protein (DUF1778 family)